MKGDDSSLEPEQYQTVHAAAVNLLNKGDAWGRFPTPIGDMMEAAQLKVAPISIFDHGAFQHYVQKAGAAVGNAVRFALDKVLAIFDVHADLVHIDPSVSNEKQNFLKLHETGHSEIPHQKGLYRFIQDCSKHLAPETAALFEREANTFASIALFQNDTFAKMTADLEFGIKVPLSHAKKFGASAYAGIREYVRRSTKACAVIVLDPTEVCPVNGMKARLHRIQVSPSFESRFGPLKLPATITPDHDIMAMIPVGSRRMSWPVDFELVDRDGTRHEFVGEGFKTPYNTFVLIHCVATLSSSVLIIPAA
jgi:hypothetical protein